MSYVSTFERRIDNNKKTRGQEQKQIKSIPNTLENRNDPMGSSTLSLGMGESAAESVVKSKRTTASYEAKERIRKKIRDFEPTLNTRVLTAMIPSMLSTS